MITSMKETITVVTVDDHLLVRQGIRSQLATDDGIELVGEGATGQDAFRLLEQHKPHVLLLDIDMPQTADHTNGKRFQIATAIWQLKDISPSTATIILSQHISSALIEASLMNGVQGYLLKSDELTGMLAQSIRAVYYGGLFFSKGIRDKIHSGTGAGINGITPRQREIILAITAQPELAYIEHARRLGITEGALKNRLGDAYRRLNVTNITSCVIECIKRGIIIISDG